MEKDGISRKGAKLAKFGKSEEFLTSRLGALARKFS
jgi:hypothetical protein